ncbi:hypothetical protein HMPREF9120_02573 [Neisseria sp. oral taxon 020 str. F0370]|nr:hypothetical protein HMPREF9120_02573 [Neisseria sp. oral taxon 020 str. F0370]
MRTARIFINRKNSLPPRFFLTLRKHIADFCKRVPPLRIHAAFVGQKASGRLKTPAAVRTEVFRRPDAPYFKLFCAKALLKHPLAEIAAAFLSAAVVKPAAVGQQRGGKQEGGRQRHGYHHRHWFGQHFETEEIRHREIDGAGKENDVAESYGSQQQRAENRAFHKSEPNHVGGAIINGANGGKKQTAD